MLLILIYCITFKPCPEYATVHFLMDFSVVVMTNKCFANINEFIFSNPGGVEAVIILLL